MLWRKLLWLGSLAAVVASLLLALPAARSESVARTATILATASNNGETSPCG
jgi:hypothetical protein